MRVKLQVSDIGGGALAPLEWFEFVDNTIRHAFAGCGDPCLAHAALAYTQISQDVTIGQLDILSFVDSRCVVAGGQRHIHVDIDNSMRSVVWP